MSLSKDRLGNKWADRIIAIMGDDAPNTADEAGLRTLMKALADEDIFEYVTNAVVTTAVPGITTGPSSAVGTGGIAS